MEKKTKNQEIIDSYDYIGNAGSARDCTGLIPANPPDEYGRESYEDIYHYLARPAGEKVQSHQGKDQSR